MPPQVQDPSALVPAAAATTLAAPTIDTGTPQQVFTKAGVSDDLALWLNRNLTRVSGQGLNASQTFDFAHLDPSIAQTLAQTGTGPVVGSRPSVLGTIVSHVLDSSARTIPVDDLKTYQTQLQRQGYLPPGYAPTGTYDPQTANAYYTATNDVAQKIAQGNRPGGLSAGNALDILFNSAMPTHVAKGIFGMLKDLGESVWGTLGHVGDLFKGQWKLTGSDLLNVITVASMFSGVGDLFEAGRGLMGMAGVAGSGAEDAAAWNLAHGLQEGASVWARPAAEQLMASPGLANKITQWGIEKVAGQGTADSFGRLVADYGPGGFAKSRAMETLGQAYSGMAKASFVPQVVAVVDPTSRLGKDVNNAPSLPAWANLPVFVLHPTDGTIPKLKDYMNLFGKSDLGIENPFRGQLGAENMPRGVDAALKVQAYAKFQAHVAMADAIGKGETDLAVSDPGTYAKKVAPFLASEAHTAFVDSSVPSRGYDPAYVKKALSWADRNGGWVTAHYNDITGSQQAREALGLRGGNPVEDLLHTQNIANQLTTEAQVGLPEFRDAQANLTDLTTKLQAARDAGNVAQARSLAQDVKDAQQTLAETHLVKLYSPEPFVVGAHYSQGPYLADENIPGVPVDKRVLAMRADNPIEATNLDRVIAAWKQGEDAREAVRPEVVQMGLGHITDDARILRNLQDYRSVAARSIMGQVDPTLAQDALDHGYQLVMGGHDVHLLTDMHPDMVPSYKYGKLVSMMSTVGFSPVARSNREIEAMSRAVFVPNLEARLAADDPANYVYGKAESLSRAVIAHQQTILDGLSQQQADPLAKVAARITRSRTSIYGATTPQIVAAIKATPNIAAGLDDGQIQHLAELYKETQLGASAAPGMLTSPNMRHELLHRFATSVRVQGLQGVSEFLRSIQLPHTGPMTFLSKLPGNHYGFLPDNLLSGAMSLRFSLNPMFEARLAVKTPVMGLTSEGLPPEFFPGRALDQLPPETRSRYDSVYARATGVDPNQIDSINRQALDTRIFGYNATHATLYNAGRMYDRQYVMAGGLADDLRAGGTLNPQADAKAMDYLRQDPHSTLSLYGPTSAAQRSMNAIFFPFNFEKKFVGNLANYLTEDPVRLFLMHYAMKRVQAWDTIGPDGQSKVARVIRKYAPILNEITKLNALKGGVGFGEFGGVYKPLAQAMSLPVQTVMGAFHPVGLQGKQTPEAKTMGRLFQGWTEINNTLQDAWNTAKVIGSAPHETTKAQIDDYFTNLKGLGDRYMQIGQLYGVSNIRGFESSSRVPAVFQEQYRQDKLLLGQQYPDGAAYAANTGANAAANDVNIQNILGVVHKDKFQEGVVALEAMRMQLSTLPTAQSGTVNAYGAILQRQLEQQAMREEGVRLLKLLGPDFNQMWIHLGYQHEFGPIAQEVV